MQPIALSRQPTATTWQQPLWTRVLLLLILAYEGAGALVGGILLVMAPDGRLMQMPAEIMHGVFVDFKIPGIILFVLGMLTSYAFLAVLRRWPMDWFMAAFSLGAFFIWFVVEIIILRGLHWLHLMWGVPILMGWIVTFPLMAARLDKLSIGRWFLVLGIFSSGWYALINLVVPLYYEGYSAMTYTVSELSAWGAPTRILWVLCASLYPVVLAAFGWGLWYNAGTNRKLARTGMLVIAYSLFNLYWPPMQMRGNPMALTDGLHITWAMITLGFMFAMIVVASGALGKNFRIYSYVSMAMFLVFGALTGSESGALAANAPTPFIGLWERINIGVFMVWIVVLAIQLLRKREYDFQ